MSNSTTNALVSRRAEQRRAMLATLVKPTTMTALEAAYDTYLGALADPSLNQAERTVLSSVGVLELRKALSGEILDKIIMPLMNTGVGFDTDRNPAKAQEGRGVTPYGKDVVLECATEAILRGLPVVGNGWNIIGGRMYPRKEGYELLLSRVCRYAAKVNLAPVDPKVEEAGGYVGATVRIKYRLLDEPEGAPARTHLGEYQVRLTKRNKVPVEFLTGKALRKAYRDLYSILSGDMLPDADDPEEEAPAALAGAQSQVIDIPEDEIEEMIEAATDPDGGGEDRAAP